MKKSLIRWIVAAVCLMCVTFSGCCCPVIPDMFSEVSSVSQTPPPGTYAVSSIGTMEGDTVFYSAVTDEILVLNEDGTSAGLKVIALEIPESTQAFRAGTWISQGEDAAFYYFFDADGVSGRTASLETGIGLGFCYEIDGENIVFRIGAEDAEIKGSLSITDADHAEIIWADGRKDSMTFVSEEGSDTFHFYTNEELCAMAIAYYTDATGEVAPLAAADLGTDTVTIQLYNNLGDHNSTYAWYQVNRLTGKVIDVN